MRWWKRKSERNIKVKFILIPASVEAINIAKEITSDSEVDIVNRSLQIYAFLMLTMNKEGKLIFIEDIATDSRERLMFL